MPISRGFQNSVNRDEFEVGNDHPLSLQQQVPEIGIAAAPVDQHAVIAVQCLDQSEADFCLAVD